LVLQSVNQELFTQQKKKTVLP